MAKQNVKVRRTIRRCKDCNEKWSADAAPIVTDELWAKIGMQPNELLCESCLHSRVHIALQRPVLFGDLIKCEFNYGWARPCAEDDEPITFYDPYVARWLLAERRKWKAGQSSAFKTETESKPTKH